MKRVALSSLFAWTILGVPVQAADEPIFSGPQVGERLPAFKAKGVFDELAGKEFDLIAQADGKPIVLVFFHSRTRPAFGLTNTVMRYAAARAKDGLTSGVVFLTDDATATENWMNVVRKHFPEGPTMGISLDGQEGPGSYGLNRNVTLTVLVGKEGKVTANFALVQPSLQADGPKILKAIVDALGGGKLPDIAQLAGPSYQPPRDRTDPKLEPLLRSLIQKDATKEDVDRAAAAVEEFVAKNAAERKRVGEIAARIVNSGKLSNYGTPAAQDVLRKWAKAYGANVKREAPDEKQNGAQRTLQGHPGLRNNAKNRRAQRKSLRTANDQSLRAVREFYAASLWSSPVFAWRAAMKAGRVRRPTAVS